MDDVATVSMYVRLLVTVGLKRLISAFLSIFGVAWLLIEPVALFFPDSLHIGWYGYGLLVAVALIGAVVWRWPRRTIAQALSSPDTVIAIKVGDLFDERAHLVVGTNDVFETELGEIIKPTSVQGQFLTRIYNGDVARLDKDISTALHPYVAERTEDQRKRKGKRWRYPIGTVVTLCHGSRQYFLTAYGRMDEKLKCTSDADCLSISLSRLWDEIRLNAQGTPVAMPILGSDLARIGLPRMALIKMIIMSYIAASKHQFVTKQITILVHPNDLDAVNLYALRDFLTSVCF